MSQTDPLDAFDDAVLARVADEAGVDATRLRRVVADHQRGVRELPGVDDIVYEWRRTLPGDPLIERRPDAYFLAVEAEIWGEFLDALDLTDPEGAALRAVHREQAAATLDAEAVPTDDRATVVLTRP